MNFSIKPKPKAGTFLAPPTLEPDLAAAFETVVSQLSLVPENLGLSENRVPHGTTQVPVVYHDFIPLTLQLFGYPPIFRRTHQKHFRGCGYH